MQRTKGERNGRFVATIGFLLLAASGCVSMYNLYFILFSVRTSGAVIANRLVRNQVRGGEPLSYFPTVEFSEPHGAVHRFEPSLGADEPLPVGATVPVLYWTGNPGSARMGGAFLWTIPLGLVGLGILFLGCGGLLIVSSRWLVNWGVPMRT